MVTSDLPREIIVEILSKLPVKSLCRFRCVAKSFRALTADPRFVRMHFNKTQREKLVFSSGTSLYVGDLDKPEIFFDHINIQAVELHYPTEGPNYEDNSVRILGCCEGLSLVYTKFSDKGVLRFGHFSVLNPFTREFKHISDFQPELEPMESYFYGFGCAQSIDDYKLVLVNYKKEIVHVFSLKKSSWKTVSLPFPRALENVSRYGKPLKETISWVSRSEVVTFDLVEEKFETLPQPDDQVLISYDVQNRNNDGYFRLEKRYGEKEYSTKILVARPWRKVKLLPFVKRSYIIFLCLDEKQLVLCDPKTGTCKNVEVEGLPLPNISFYDAEVFAESLVSPNCNNSDLTIEGLLGF